jgi:hypothetical protein
MLLYAGTYPVLVNAIPQDADAFFTMVKGVVNGLNLAQVGQSVVTSVAWPIPRRAGTNMLYLCSR